MDGYFNPMAAQQTTAPELTQDDARRQALLRAMQGINANQASALNAEAGIGNALAQGLSGYMRGTSLRRPEQPAPGIDALLRSNRSVAD